MADTTEKRGRTVPVPQWWLDRVAEVKGAETDEGIASRIKALTGREYSRHDVMRCRKGTQPVLELVNDMSLVLEIARPFVVARSEPEAREIAGVVAGRDERERQRLQQLDVRSSVVEIQVAELEAGVGKVRPKDQTVRVDTVHADSADSARSGGRRSKRGR